MPLDTAHTRARPNLMDAYASSMGDAVRRHRKNVALRAAKVEAELAHRARNEFLANMNHELRTPLNAVIGFAEMLKAAEQMGLDDAQRAEYAGYISHSANGLLSLINEVLDFAALESGQYAPKSVEIDLAALAEETLSRFETLAGRSEVRVEGPRRSVVADVSAVSKVMEHLVRNAADFAGEDARVLIRIVDQGGAFLWTSVEDDGVGMSGEALSNVLDPFRQASEGLAREHEGAGLGITLSKQFVEAMGGSFVLRGSMGGGVQATFSLGAAREQSADEAGV